MQPDIIPVGFVERDTIDNYSFFRSINLLHGK